MSIANKLNYLLETKTLFKNLLVAKGEEVSDDDTFRSYVDKFASLLNSNIGGNEPSTDNTPALYYKKTDAGGTVYDLLNEAKEAELLTTPYTGVITITWKYGTATIYKLGNGVWENAGYDADMEERIISISSTGHYKVVVKAEDQRIIERQFKIINSTPVYRFSDSKGRNEFVGLYDVEDIVTLTIENPDTVTELKIVPENDPNFTEELKITSFEATPYTYTFTCPANMNEYVAYTIYITTIGGETFNLGEVFYYKQ